MAAGVNPYLSIDPAAEGKSAPHELIYLFVVFLFIFNSNVLYIYFIIGPFLILIYRFY